MAFSDLGKLYDPDGLLLPIHKIPLAVRRSIKKIKKNKLGIEFELYDKLEALRMGAEYAGMKPAEKHEYDLSGSLMAAVAAYLTNDGSTKQNK